MNNAEEENFLSDKRFLTLKKIFFYRLNERKDIQISILDAEETFQSLWIYLNKKNPHLRNQCQEFVSPVNAELIYKFYVDGNKETLEYLDNLLISFSRDR